jgi:hypothetical protein
MKAFYGAEIMAKFAHYLRLFAPKTVKYYKIQKNSLLRGTPTEPKPLKTTKDENGLF